MDENFSNDIKPIIARAVAELLAIAIAATTSFAGSKALGLFRGNQTVGIPGEFEMHTYSIFDEGAIVFGAALGVAFISSTIAAKKAPIGRAALLGVLSGFLSAAVLLAVSKFGISEGPPVFAAAIIAALVIGFGLQLLLNRQPAKAA